METFKFVLFCLFIIYINTANGQEPSIVDDILPDIKRIGETGMLNCTVARLGSNSLTWTKSSTGDLLSRGKKIHVINTEIEGRKRFEVIERNDRKADRITFTLIIRFLQEDDAGRYICKIETLGSKPDEYPQKYGTITVLSPPKITLSMSKPREELEEGSSKDLWCNATGMPTPNITWVRTNGNMLPTMEYSHRGSVLHLKNVRRDDQGVYRCVADNTVRPPDHLDVRVYIISPPRVKYVQNTVGQAQNGQYHAILECRVSSYPDAVLRWYKKTAHGREELTDTDKYEIQKLESNKLGLGETWYKLKVKNVLANDFGIYYCTARNVKGQSENQITLFETLECQGPNCISPAGRGSPLTPHSGLLFTLTVGSIVLLSRFYSTP
ncbi:lachesin-like [Argonauta hians]